WEPLLAIAEVIGVTGPAKAAALAACGEEELGLNVELLADIKEVFDTDKTGEPTITSSALTARLVAMVDRPWGELDRGRELTQNSLPRRLKGFGLRPKQARHSHGRPIRCYMKSDFNDAFARYLPNPTGTTGTLN